MVLCGLYLSFYRFKKNSKCDPNKKYGFDIKKFAAEGMKKKTMPKKVVISQKEYVCTI
jgi:hypothetical protein